MKVSYQQAANDDVVRQIRYYLIQLNLPEIAFRFRDAVRLTIDSLRTHPFIGPGCVSQNPQLQKLRSWPVTGFEAIRIYYIPDDGIIRVIRILHGKRDVKRLLERERI